MIGVIIDIDDTLIDSEMRVHAILEYLLEQEILLEDMQSLTIQEIFYKYATPTQKTQASELKNLFQDLLLCRTASGIELLKHNKPVPFAAEVLETWSKNCNIVYLTGRIETIRDHTIGELVKFGFPTHNLELVMFDPEDYGHKNSILEARDRLLSTILNQNNIVRVVDDFPGYFTSYKKFSIPERIGLHRSKQYSKEDYLDQGATRVIECWSQLINDPPTSPKNRILPNKNS